MGTTLAAEDAWVEERFAEIVAVLGESGAAWAKIRPYEDDAGDGSSREEDLEPWDDEDGPDGGDVEFP